MTTGPTTPAAASASRAMASNAVRQRRARRATTAASTVTIATLRPAGRPTKVRTESAVGVVPTSRTRVSGPVSSVATAHASAQPEAARTDRRPASGSAGPETGTRNAARTSVPTVPTAASRAAKVATGSIQSTSGPACGSPGATRAGRLPPTTSARTRTASNAVPAATTSAAVGLAVRGTAVVAVPVSGGADGGRTTVTTAGGAAGRRPAPRPGGRPPHLRRSTCPTTSRWSSWPTPRRRPSPPPSSSHSPTPRRRRRR